MTEQRKTHKATALILAPIMSVLLVGTVHAGGFEVREQSTHYQGMSFAGAASGSTLSSLFWNPAAATAAGNGLSAEAGLAVILPESEITGDTTSPVGFDAFLNSRDQSVDIGIDVAVPASYMAYRLPSNNKIVVAVGINSQFGLGTKPDNLDWSGQAVSQSAKIFSANVNPTVSYDVMPGVTVGAGLQVQHFDLVKLNTSLDPAFTGAPFFTTGARSHLSGHDRDFGYGFTAGVLLKPFKGTSIGVGYRSSIEHDLAGKSATTIPGGGTSYVDIKADVETPDKVTASFSQHLSPRMRVHGTVEWTNWSVLDIVPVIATETVITNTGLIVEGQTIANIDAQWDDGWFFSLGGEFDYNDKLTLRAGGAYEISPIRGPNERLLQVPDADRVWVSAGATYKWSDTMSFDVAYSHVFVEEATAVRSPASTSLAATSTFTGDVESSVDIIAIGAKLKW